MGLAIGSTAAGAPADREKASWVALALLEEQARVEGRLGACRTGKDVSVENYGNFPKETGCLEESQRGLNCRSGNGTSCGVFPVDFDTNFVSLREGDIHLLEPV